MKSEIQLFVRVLHTEKMIIFKCLRFNVHDTGMNGLINAQFVLAQTAMASYQLKTGDDSTTHLFLKSFNCCEKQIFIFRHIFMVLRNDHFMNFIKFLYVLNSTCV